MTPETFVDGIFRHELGNYRLALDANRYFLEELQDEQEKMILIKKIEILSRKVKNLEEEWVKYQMVRNEMEWCVLLDIFNEYDSKIKINCASGLAVTGIPAIKIIFLSLINNTVMHGGENVGKIDIWWKKTSDGVIIVYEDNGLGIPQTKKPHIFKKGFGDHTGLGLYLVKEVLEKSGWNIIENGVYGNGARFEINVPEGSYRLY
jgi:signal transduction histidine kinase